MSITISLSPNVQRDDLIITFKTLFAFWRWRDKTITNSLETKISKRFNGNEVALLSSGRSAIYRTLQALNIGRGDEVIIQAFTCLAVPAPIQWTGAKPIYADIRRDTYNFDINDVRKKITSHTKAIIIQHTFGIPAPVIELKELAKQHNIYLIEDLAHGLGAAINQQPIGTFGDVAILSFGRDKAISCVFGGAVTSSNVNLINKIKSQQKALPYPPFWWTKQQLLHPIFMALIKPLYFNFSLGKIILVLSQKTKLLSLAVTKKEKTGAKPIFIDWKFSPALGFLLNNQLGKLNQYTKHRREIASYYISKMKLSHPYDSIQRSTSASWLRLPITVNSSNQLLHLAQKNKILLGDWYNNPVTPVNPSHPNTSQYQTGSCPVAEDVSKHIINLPTHQAISHARADEIMAFLSQHLNHD